MISLIYEFLDWGFPRRNCFRCNFQAFFDAQKLKLLWFVSKLSPGVHYEDNLEYTFEKIILKLFGYFLKILLATKLENIIECTFEKIL